jgi:hypothetical protein
MVTEIILFTLALICMSIGLILLGIWVNGMINNRKPRKTLQDIINEGSPHIPLKTRQKIDQDRFYTEHVKPLDLDFGEYPTIKEPVNG